jgi:hypothetical protein
MGGPRGRPGRVLSVSSAEADEVGRRVNGRASSRVAVARRVLERADEEVGRRDRRSSGGREGC